MRTSILDSNNTVVNVVILPKEHNWTPPEGQTIGPAGGEIGDVWNGTVYIKPAPVTPSLTEADYANAAQYQIDLAAHSRGYADGVALASYISSTVPSWKAEAEAFITWRDSVWAQAYTLLGEVQGGQRPVPTLEEFIELLPKITWPEA